MSFFDEGSNILIRAYIPVPGGASALLVTDVDPLSGVDLAVYDGNTAVYSLSGISAGSAIVTLTQFGWTYDSRGYNFSYTIPGGAFTPVGGKDYRIEFKVWTTSYGMIRVNKLANCAGSRS